ncbi:universal stress protein [Aeromicrobium sp. 9AM]|uniref:universal stress protein n=1 Tax=Aeromicrobium sp. 9AM TaxID=2653126 RepID=UPI00135C3805|nr:universal stress protein [Aeromicrobium sp. 9AM]
MPSEEFEEAMDTTARDLPVVAGVADKQPTVLDYARREAERAGCGLKLVHAYTVPPSAMGSIYSLDIPEAFRAGGQEILDEAVRHLENEGCTSPIETVLTRGYAPSVLEAESGSARQMIIGPDESKPWYIRMFEGKVAHELVERGECPVIVVPDSWRPTSHAAPVVVMVDGETSAHGPLKFAFDAASARGAELRVLHVTPPADGLADSEWEAIRRVVDSWFDHHPQVRGGSQEVASDVREAALRAAEGAGILVLGRPHDRRLSNLLMDSLAQEILSEAGSPVAVVPAEYRG